MQKLHADQVFELYLTALARVYDPHSDYMGPRQLEDFNISMKLSLCGIGAVLQSEDGYCKIREVLPGGPAALSKKIKVGDRIVAVAQEEKEPVDIIEMPLPDAVRLIRGDKGTKVTLTLIPVDADASVRQSVSLVRDEIRVEQQQAKARIVDLPGKDAKPVRLGVVDLPSFYLGTDNGKGKREGATADVAKLIEKLKRESIQGLLLDLRRNGGGSLDEAISLTGLFIERGPVVQTKDANGTVSVAEDTDPAVLYDGPLVVLTSRISASASEILAAAVQDYGRGLVLGDPSTFGKGTVQSVVQLGPIMQQNRLDGGVNPGALKLTIRKFYRPDGGSTQRKGVVPDLVLPSGSAVLKVGEAEMVTSLPWDEIPATGHARLNRVGSKLPALRERSAARIADEQEFAWLREDSDRLRTQLAQAAVSLNEKQRLQEKTEQEKRDEARKKARINHPPAKETQYEITLKLTDLEGLPKPVTPGTNDVAAAPDVTLLEATRVLADFVGLGATESLPPGTPGNAGR
jgi:carboxyl-terminal processing protease